MRQKFIVFEGIYGSGSQHLSLSFALKYNWFWTQQPTFSTEKIIKLNSPETNDFQRETEFLIDKIQYVQKYSEKPLLVCHRFIWSALVFSMKFSPKTFQMMKQIYANPYFLKPDWYIFLDTPTDICQTNYKKLSINELDKFRKAFMSTEELISKHSKVLTISCLGKEQDIVESIYKFVNNEL